MRYLLNYVILNAEGIMARYRDLIIFQKADKLAYEIYKLTQSFPKNEMFGITSQLPRFIAFKLIKLILVEF